MDFIDYYKVLELSKNASDSEIKKAYRKLARKYHPDLNPNDAAAKIKFQQINEANQVLSDPEKRRKYNEYGKDWKHGDEAKRYRSQRQSQSQPFAGSFAGQDFSDFFESMFGGATSQSQSGVKYRGQDVEAQLRLDLKDVYRTHKQTLSVNGKNIRITIPAGVTNGQTIKIKGYGGQGINGGPNGDLYITFSISNNTSFKREGNSLHANVQLDLYTAVLGGDMTIDTFDGKVKIKVEPQTQNGTKVKLRGKGFPVYKKEGEFGDLFVTWQLKMPTSLTPREKELFEELAKIKSNGR